MPGSHLYEHGGEPYCDACYDQQGGCSQCGFGRQSRLNRGNRPKGWREKSAGEIQADIRRKLAELRAERVQRGRH